MIDCQCILVWYGSRTQQLMTNSLYACGRFSAAGNGRAELVSEAAQGRRESRMRGTTYASHRTPRAQHLQLTTRDASAHALRRG